MIKRMNLSSSASILAAVLLFGGCTTSLSQAEPARDVVCFQSARLSLKDAVEIAERQGGRAVDARYRQDHELGCLVNQPGYYAVTLIQDGMLRSLAIDARTQMIRSAQDKATILERFGRSLDRIFDHDPVESAELAPGVELKLAEAISLAENASSKAIKAYVDMKDGQLGYAVKLVERGKVRLAWIDAGTMPTLARK